MRQATLALILAVAATASTAVAQMQPLQPPARRVTVGDDIGRYEALYGTPEFRELGDQPWPRRQAIRSVGRLEEIPGRGRGGQSWPELRGVGGAYDDPHARLRLCAGSCVALVAVPEMQDAFASSVLVWLGHEVEVLGAVDQLPTPGPGGSASWPWVFFVWTISEPAAGPARGNGAGRSNLEALVRHARDGDGGRVTASGTFRGANLFQDLPPESRRNAADWVLKDGPFSIWVTGKAPKGSGWSLDVQSRSECRWRLEVTGKVEHAGGYMYLRATAVALLGRAPDEP